MAKKTQQSYLSVSTAEAAADVISGITVASPPVVTATAHGIANGTIVRIASVVGMLEVNNRAFVVANQATNTVELKGVDGTGYTAYGSAGSMFAQTMAEVGEVRGISGFDGEASEIDVTHLRSISKEYLIGLQDFGNVNVRLWIPTGGNTAQARMRKLKETATAAAFSITMSDGEIAAFMGLVKSFAFEEMNPDGAFGGNVVIRVTSAPAWWA